MSISLIYDSIKQSAAHDYFSICKFQWWMFIDGDILIWNITALLSGSDILHLTSNTSHYLPQTEHVSNTINHCYRLPTFYKSVLLSSCKQVVIAGCFSAPPKSHQHHFDMISTWPRLKFVKCWRGLWWMRGHHRKSLKAGTSCMETMRG